MAKAYKFKVVQEYEVVIYYESGVVGANEDEKDEQIVTDVLELAFNHEGLVLSTEETNEGVNNYIGLVTTYDPTVEEVYQLETAPTQIKAALAEKGFLIG